MANKRDKLRPKECGYTLNDLRAGRHVARDVTAAMSRDEWLSRKEIIQRSFEDNDVYLRTFRVRASLDRMKILGLIECRIRTVKPLKGFTVEDVLKKVTEGTAKHNTGVIVNEWRIADLPDWEEQFEDYIQRSLDRIEAAHRGRANRNKPKKKKWYAKRKLKPEEVLYILQNPDRISQKNLGRMFGISQAAVASIQHGKTYKDFNLKKYVPRRDEIFRDLRKRKADFIAEYITKTF